MKQQHPFSIKERLHSFVYAFNGLKLFFTREHNVRIHLVVAIVTIGMGFFVGVSPMEWVAIALTIGVVLAAEAVNTAIESICDLVSPGYSEYVRRAKDLAAGAVLLLAAASVCDLPVFCSLTIEADGSLFFGGTIYDAVEELEAMGAAAVGCNCSTGPDQLEAVISGIRKRVSIPVIAKPNAGMPVISETGEAVYHMGPSEFARHMAVLRRAGASILGGCCGTTPEFIRELKKGLAR